MIEKMENFHEKFGDLYECNSRGLFPSMEKLFWVFEHSITESARVSLWELTDSERREIILTLKKDMMKILEDILS